MGLAGTTDGTVEIWDLEDRRVLSAWPATEGGLLSVQGLDSGRSCLSQGKNGCLKLWDVQSKAPTWHASLSSCSFAKSLVLPRSDSAGLDVSQMRNDECVVCSPSAEQHVIGVFDMRTDGDKFSLTLDTSARQKKPTQGSSTEVTNPLGMCMALCGVPCLGPTYLISVYESTDTCIWDLRLPREPTSPSVLAGDPNSPSICAVSLWKQAWVACADGSIAVLKVKKNGQLACTPTAVHTEDVPYGKDAGNADEAWQNEKGGVNMLAARADLRLVAAARWDHRLELFDVKTARSLGRLPCHNASVLSAAFDRERGALATGGEDGRIALWSIFVDSYTGPFVRSS